MVWLPEGEVKDTFYRLDRISACDRRTDRQTDGRTDIFAQHSPRYNNNNNNNNNKCIGDDTKAAAFVKAGQSALKNNKK